MRRALAASLLAVVLPAAAPQVPQQVLRPQPPPLQQPVFRGRIDLIQIDVSILDADRRPVRGLTAKDFTLFEDGQPQTISAVVEMSATDPEAPADSWLRTVVPDVHVNNAEDGRVLMLIMDDALTPALAYGRDRRPLVPSPKDAAKQVARAIVERLGPADLAAVIFTVKNKNEQEFTSDRNRLFAAIDEFDPLTSNEYNELRAYDTFKSASRFLATIPQRRKAIVLISGRPPAVLPLDVPAVAIVGADFAKNEGMKQEALQEALRGNVAIYSVNPLAMGSLDDEVEQLLDPATAAANPSATAFSRPTGGPPVTPKYYADVRPSPLDVLTGGFSIRRSADFAAGITQIFRETGSYYLLGYTNPDAKNDGNFRKIEVRVTRPDLTVRARTGYLAPKQKDTTAYVSPMWNAISGLLPAKDIPLRITSAAFAIPGKKEVAVAIAVGLREPVAPEATADIPESVRFLTQAFTTNGDRRGDPQYVTAELLLHPTTRGEAKYEVLSLLKLKPGRYHVRLSATSKVQGKSGSIYTDIDVPDYSKAPMSLSGVVVSVSPALVAGPKEMLASIIPVVPTTQREFQGHRAQAFMRVYQGGKTPIAAAEMSVRIVDAANAVMLERVDPLPAESFDRNRAAEYRFDLPVTALPPGRYLATFEARLSGAPSSRQDVRFEVRPK